MSGDVLVVLHNASALRLDRNLLSNLKKAYSSRVPSYLNTSSREISAFPQTKERRLKTQISGKNVKLNT